MAHQGDLDLCWRCIHVHLKQSQHLASDSQVFLCYGIGSRFLVAFIYIRSKISTEYYFNINRYSTVVITEKSGN